MAKTIVRGNTTRFGRSAALLLGSLGTLAATDALAAAGQGQDAAAPPDLATGNGFTMLAALPQGVSGPVPAAGPVQTAQADATTTPETVGKPPEDEDAIDSLALGGLSAGGVLTPAGMLVVEPSFTYSHTGTNRFTFRGTEIIETVLLGVVEAEDADRDFLEAAVGLRYGITDRLEIEARFPYVYRNDTVRTTANIGGSDVSVSDTTEGNGIGDIELAGHYQLNAGGGGIPFFVANLRGKSRTGRGPFDVDRDANGIETELPTGSGFYAVEPSLTVIYPTDPVVLFGTVGYLWNIKRDVDKTIGDSEIGEVDPGNAIRLGFGFSFAVNENMSFSISYSQDLIDNTETEVDGIRVEGEDLTVGQMTVGFTHRLTDRMSIDVGTTWGVTGDATDVTVGIRLPIRLQLFDY